MKLKDSFTNFLSKLYKFTKETTTIIKEKRKYNLYLKLLYLL